MRTASRVYPREVYLSSKKRLSDSVVVNLLQQMLDSQQHMGRRLDDVVMRLAEVVGEQRVTNERLERFEKAVVGVGRVVALEERIKRIEDHVGLTRES